jgi:hypothetical protein
LLYDRRENLAAVELGKLGGGKAHSEEHSPERRKFRGDARGLFATVSAQL